MKMAFFTLLALALVGALLFSLEPTRRKVKSVLLESPRDSSTTRSAQQPGPPTRRPPRPNAPGRDGKEEEASLSREPGAGGSESEETKPSADSQEGGG